MNTAAGYLSRASEASPLFKKFVKSLTRKNASHFLGLYILWIVFKYRSTAYGTKPRYDLKGPRGLPLIGNMITMVMTPRDQISQQNERMHEEYGTTFSFSVPKLGRIIQFSDPDVLEHVLKTNFWAYEKGPVIQETLSDLLGTGIFGADGDHWKWQRKMASHIFNVKAFRNYTSSVFVKEANVLVDYLDKVAQEGRVVDIHHLFYLFTLDSFGEVSFGQSFGCLKKPEEEVEFAAAFDRLNTVVFNRLFDGFWQIREWTSGMNKQVAKDKKTINDFAMNIVNSRRINGYDKPQKDLLQLFMDMDTDDGTPLSDEMLCCLVLNFIMSTSDQSIVSKLTKEVDEVLEGGLPSYETCKKMKYSEACLYEALRLYPSVPRNIKVAVQDDVWPDGTKVYKGEFVSWSSWAMGRSTSIWGSDAKDYNPDRWMTGEKPSPTKFPGFHAGPRTCLGQQFATIEAVTIMGMLFQKFKFELVDPHTEPGYVPGLTLPMAKGLPMDTQSLSRTAKSSTVLNFIIKYFDKSHAPKTVLSLFALYFLIKYRDNAVGTRRTNIPGPKGLPFIGNLILMATTPMNRISQLHDEFHAKYGSTWTFTMPFLGRGIMVNDPVVLEHVLKNNFWAYEKGLLLRDSMADLLGTGIFNTDGQHWKWQRKMASHIFNVKAFRDYTGNVFVKESNVVAAHLDTITEKGTTVDIHDLLLKFTLDSFGEVSFSQSFGCLSDPGKEVEFAAAFDRLSAVVSERLFRGPWRLVEWLTGVDRQVAKDRKTVVDFALNVIRHRRANGLQKPQKDLLQLFMDLKGDDGEYLSDDMLKDSILNFIIAGRDTTAQALSWMFYLMHRSSSDQNIVLRLQKEIDDVLGDELPTYESSKKMKYAEACLHEALRLYPSVPRNLKVCVEDDILPNGVEIKKGESFLWSSWTMGRDTNIWGPDAKEFNPDRWLQGEMVSPTKFPAFHAGPRTCLGQQFATIEAITFMSILFRRFNFELVDPNREVEYAAGLTLPVANGLPIRVSRRERENAVQNI
ncbi:serine/threonine protein kinase, CMGC, dual-specificity [Mortierella sp. AD094]|nr:serine/threonine protein kinase, CMGC, dual-specificity [Mortierella sp. AD094]